MTRRSEQPHYHQQSEVISQEQFTQETTDDYDMLQKHLYTQGITIPDGLNRLYDLNTHKWQFQPYGADYSPHSLFLGYAGYEHLPMATVADAETTISLDTIPRMGPIVTMAKPIEIQTESNLLEKHILTLGYLPKTGLYHVGLTIRQSQIHSLHGAHLLPASGIYDSLHGLITPAMINALDNPYDEEDPILFSRAYKLQRNQPPEFNGQSANLNRWYQHGGLVLRKVGRYDLAIGYANTNGTEEWAITIPEKLSKVNLLK